MNRNQYLTNMNYCKCLLAALLIPAAALSQNYEVPVSEAQEPMMKGKYDATWESLSQYEVPEWFRDAKFGIWAH